MSKNGRLCDRCRVLEKNDRLLKWLGLPAQSGLRQASWSAPKPAECKQTRSFPNLQPTSSMAICPLALPTIVRNKLTTPDSLHRLILVSHRVCTYPEACQLSLCRLIKHSY